MLIVLIMDMDRSFAGKFIGEEKMTRTDGGRQMTDNR